MKSHSLTLIVFLAACTYCGTAKAEQPSSQILTRQQVTAIARESASAGEFPELPLRSRSADQDASGSKDPTTKPKVSRSLVTISSSLAVVLGLFAGLVWMSRKFGSHSGHSGAIPKDVVQTLGSTAIDSRNRITMIRCGHRILVLAQNAQGVQPIAEITSPEEVRELTAACLGDSKKAFVTTLQSIEQERANAGFLGEQTAPPTPRSRGRLFASA